MEPKDQKPRISIAIKLRDKYFAYPLMVLGYFLWGIAGILGLGPA